MDNRLAESQITDLHYQIVELQESYDALLTQFKALILSRHNGEVYIEFEDSMQAADDAVHIEQAQDAEGIRYFVYIVDNEVVGFYDKQRVIN